MPMRRILPILRRPALAAVGTAVLGLIAGGGCGEAPEALPHRKDADAPAALTIRDAREIEGRIYAAAYHLPSKTHRFLEIDRATGRVRLEALPHSRKPVYLVVRSGGSDVGLLIANPDRERLELWRRARGTEIVASAEELGLRSIDRMAGAPDGDRAAVLGWTAGGGVVLAVLGWDGASPRVIAQAAARGLGDPLGSVARLTWISDSEFLGYPNNAEDGPVLLLRVDAASGRVEIVEQAEIRGRDDMIAMLSLREAVSTEGEEVYLNGRTVLRGVLPPRPDAMFDATRHGFTRCGLGFLSVRDWNGRLLETFEAEGFPNAISLPGAGAVLVAIDNELMRVEIGEDGTVKTERYPVP